MDHEQESRESRESREQKYEGGKGMVLQKERRQRKTDRL